jgi:Integrase core domain
MPFQIWAIDTIPSLPVDDEGYKAIVVAVDCFTKWVELRALKDKEAASMAAFFEEQILSRFGCPAELRSDNGTEFEGEFNALVSNYGIARHPISAGYP